ncbi:transmembrane protein 41B isoform X1 [Calypte anna]|uniref:transmembrane protein 41B isoform X1 n=2 Tax=Calypte anna TaxID=9244 RepID=UPI0011C3BD72|nr:transmembrane protein 41B isoform X1 [Calypte anna]
MAQRRAAERGPCEAESARHQRQLLEGKAQAEGGSARTSLLILVSIFLSAAFLMFLVYKNFPQLSEEEREYIKVPRDMDDAKALGKVLSKYKDTFYVQVLVAYFATYVFLQTFAIPGSIFLSILSGFLYPFPLALFLVCLCSGLGASFCYMLSYLVGRPVVYRYLTEKVVKWSEQVERHREHLINYIIFLRITPFLPNWFINITSPVINVPLKVFFIGTFLAEITTCWTAERLQKNIISVLLDEWSISSVSTHKHRKINQDCSDELDQRCSTTVFCSHKGRNNAIPTYNSRGSCFLELCFCSHDSSHPLHPTSCPPEEIETEVPMRIRLDQNFPYFISGSALLIFVHLLF